MLHNSGPFDPNDVPNMGAPANMSQNNSPMNMAHNMINIDKLHQQPHQSSSGHYDTSNYTNYPHPSFGIPAQMNQIPSYNPAAYHSNFMHQSANQIHASGINHVQNNMMPMNLNVHSSDNNHSHVNYDHTFEKVSQISHINSQFYDKNESLYPKTMPINIPQIHTKAFHKHMGVDRDNSSDNNYEPVNPSIDSFRHYEGRNFGLNQSQLTKAEQDNLRRKSLENTVRLIENILINSTPSSKRNETSSKAESLSENTQVIEKSQSVSDRNHTEVNDFEVKHNNKDIQSKIVSINKQKNEVEIVNKSVEKVEVSDNDEETQSESDEDVKPVGLIEKEVAKTENEVDGSVMVKVEAILSWTDTEYSTPFCRDVHSTLKSSINNSLIIDSEISVNKAKDDIQNGSSQNKYYECPYCSLLFSHPKRFLVHTKWHSFGLTNDKRIELAKEKELKKTLKKEARMLENQQAKLKEAGDGEKYPCKDCDQVFAGKSGLKNHRQKHHPSESRQCKVCLKVVGGWGALRSHMKTHTGVTEFQCGECPKRFKYAHSLANHRGTHMEKTHLCPECPKKFGSATQLRMHRKCHERALRGATHRCTYCGKGFYEAYNLQVHERTHRNEKPFHCTICNTSYGTNSSLQRHIRVSHSKSKPYECPTCHRCFATESIREHHRLRAHGDPAAFKFPCERCPSRYLTLKDLKKHLYKAHPKGKRKRAASDSE